MNVDHYLALITLGAEFLLGEVTDLHSISPSAQAEATIRKLEELLDFVNNFTTKVPTLARQLKHPDLK